MSFCRILRHIRVMFSTTTGVLMFTDMRNRLRAGWGEMGTSVSRMCLVSLSHAKGGKAGFTSIRHSIKIINICLLLYV